MIGGFADSFNFFDVTPFSKKYFSFEFTSNDFVVFALPVFGGRLPKPVVDRIRNFKGSSTFCSIAVVYGNRDYEDALIELRDLVTECGFVPVSAGAFVAEHSIARSVAHGRPDEDDFDDIRMFIEDSKSRISELGSPDDEGVLFVKGSVPYRDYSVIPVVPEAVEGCTLCMTCISECPFSAIDVRDPAKTNKDLCMSCMRCVKVCPEGVRKVSGELLSMLESKLSSLCHDRRKSEFFI
ncbi:MAG: 4Fe-4S binding protein [Synergistaceae bacterium]